MTEPTESGEASQVREAESDTPDLANFVVDLTTSGSLPDIDPLELGKEILVGLVGLIPYVGSIAGYGLGFLWDSVLGSPKDPLGKLKEWVNQVVDKKITEGYFQDLKQRIAGLEEGVRNYSQIAEIGQDKEHIRSTWTSAYQSVLALFPPCKDSRFPVALTPFYAQVANLHFLLLRDMVRHGKSWEFDDTTVEKYKGDLCGAADPDTEEEYSHVAWVMNRYRDGLNAIGIPVVRSYIDFERVMTIHAAEFAQDIWPYFHPVKYPDKVDVKRDREVFLGPFGVDINDAQKWWIRDCHPRPNNQPLVVGFRLYTDGNRIQSMAVRFASGWWEPIGDGSSDKDVIWEFGERDPITRIWVAGTDFDSYQRNGIDRFAFARGSNETSWYGHKQNLTNVEVNDFSIPNYRLSNIYGNGMNKQRDAILGLAFGFVPDPDPELFLPKRGRTYAIVSAKNFLCLDLKSLSTTEGEPVVARYRSYARSQHWTLTYHPEKPEFGFVNNYSGLFLTYAGRDTTYNFAHLRQKKSTGKDDVVNTFPRFVKREQGISMHIGVTERLKQDERCVHPAEKDELPDIQDYYLEGAEWLFREVVVKPHPDASAASVPLLSFIVPPAQQSPNNFSGTLEIINPAGGTPITDWTLSFYLPKGLGGEVRVSGGDGAELVSAQSDDYGLAIVVQAAARSAKKAIPPGDTFRFALSGGTADPASDIRGIHIVPDCCRINGAPILS